MRQMTLAEARDVVRGLERRHRDGWSQMRMIIHAIGADPDGELKFPWEEGFVISKDESPEESQRAWERMEKNNDKIREMMLRHEAELKQQ